MRRISPEAVLRRLRRDGLGGIARRVLFELYHASGAATAGLPLDEEDIASSHGLELCPAGRLAPGASARIAWVCNAPVAGSGGHTTLFRMAAALAARGHRNTIVLYGARPADLAAHARVIAEAWPWLDAEVSGIDDGFDGFDAVVASSWASAHVVARRTAALPVCRFYFVQDFEPFFYPRGALYSLAEDTYRFGFDNIALGVMVAEALADIDVPAVMVPFGHDDGVYHLDNTGPRRGVGAYVRVGNDRRGYLLLKLALERFHELHPEQPIHVYGDEVHDWRIPVTAHGHLPPERLNALYNTLVAGVALSFTNVSLVAGELLAAGVVPVINDHPDARADLPHPEVVWSAPNPAALAAALAAAVEHPDVSRRALRAARPVTRSWSVTGEAVADHMERALRGDVASRRVSRAL